MFTVIKQMEEVVYTRMIGNFKVRYLERNHKPWFVMADMCEFLDYKNVQATLKNLRKTIPDGISKGKMLTNVGIRDVNVINTEALCELILTSTKDNAKVIQKWFSKFTEDNLDKIISESQLLIKNNTQKDTIILNQENRISKQEELLKLQVSRINDLQSKLNNFLNAKPEPESYSSSSSSSSTQHTVICHQFDTGCCVAILSTTVPGSFYTAYQVIIEPSDINARLRMIQSTQQIVMVDKLIYVYEDRQTAQDIKTVFDAEFFDEKHDKLEGWFKCYMDKYEMLEAIGEKLSKVNGGKLNDDSVGFYNGQSSMVKLLNHPSNAIPKINNPIPVSTPPAPASAPRPKLSPDEIIEELNIHQEEKSNMTQEERMKLVNEIRGNRPASLELRRERLAMEEACGLNDPPMLWSRREPDEPPKLDLRWHYHIVDGRKVSYEEKRLLMAEKEAKKKREIPVSA
jgi:prophage antirepressor-like protein